MLLRSLKRMILLFIFAHSSLSSVYAVNHSQKCFKASKALPSLIYLAVSALHAEAFLPSYSRPCASKLKEIKGLQPLGIVGGQTLLSDSEHEKFPEVKNLIFFKADGSKFYSSGVFIGEDTLITAAGSVVGVEAIAVVMDLEVEEPIEGSDYVFANEWFTSVQFMQEADQTLKRQNDLAILKFPYGTCKTYAKLSRKPAKANDSIKLVGFGADSIGQPSPEAFMQKLSKPIKREGANTIEADVPEELACEKVFFAQSTFKINLMNQSMNLVVEDQKPKAAASNGDAGGAVYDENDQLIGIMSGVYTMQPEKQLISNGSPFAQTSIYTVFLDLQSDYSLKFLEMAEGFGCNIN